MAFVGVVHQRKTLFSSNHEKGSLCVEYFYFWYHINSTKALKMHCKPDAENSKDTTSGMLQPHKWDFATSQGATREMVQPYGVLQTMCYNLKHHLRPYATLFQSSTCKNQETT